MNLQPVTDGMAPVNDTLDFPSLVASAAHDMKNSLNLLLGSLREMGENCDSACQAFTHIKQMQHEASRVSHNLIQLLGIYKIDRKQFSINITDNAVYEFLNEAIAGHSHILSFSGITVNAECPDDLYWFFDRDLVAGIIHNVFNNAINLHITEMTIRASEQDGFLVISVEDNGEGYPEEMLQAGRDERKGINLTTGSTGLGLYFASMAVKLHKNRGRQGRLRIHNTAASGGCLTLMLP